jgi:hypothetical protein
MAILRRYPYVLLAAFTFVLSIMFYGYRHHTFQPHIQTANIPSKGPFDGQWNFTRDARNLLMNDSQCDLAFPDLFKEIDRAVESRKRKPITFKEVDSVQPIRGYNRAMIYDNQVGDWFHKNWDALLTAKLYLIAVDLKVNSRDQATLHALHRAIVTSPEPLPNIEFTFNADDIASPDDTTWAYSRRKSDNKLWLMPDFGYWSWPEPKIGSYSEVQMKATAMDAKVPWARKIDKLVWRGAMMDLLVREQLFEASAGHEWADIKILNWEDEAQGLSHNVLTMDEHCGYKFVAHTEGVSYSARLQNLQNCQSVIVAHKLQWIQHHHHLMVTSGPDQNFVEVGEDFSGLDVAMDMLVGDDELAQRIAENSVKTFREHYLTPAAETCYWRKLIRGWATVSFEPEFYTKGTGEEVKWRGLPVESYFLERTMDWDYH